MRKLKSTLLERLCERINKNTVTMLNNPNRSAYQRYLDIFKQIQIDNEAVANAFDDWRRSTIAWKILEIYRQELFTDGELQGFTLETQQRIHDLMLYMKNPTHNHSV